METQENQLIEEQDVNIEFKENSEFTPLDEETYDFVFDNDTKEQVTTQSNQEQDLDFNLGNWISEKLDLKDGIIKLDVGNQVIERNVNDLTLKQQTAIINHYTNQLENNFNNSGNQYTIPEDKKLILDYLDKGEEGLRFLKEEIDRELGYADTGYISDDDLIAAKISNDFEFLNEEELAEEVEKFKSDDYFDSKMEILRNKYQQQILAQREQQEFSDYNQLGQQLEYLKETYIDAARKTELVGEDSVEGGFFTLDFDDPEDTQLINDTLADLIESDDPNDPTPRYIKYLQEPANIYKTALMQKALPKIQKLVQDLITENEELKKEKPRTIIGDVNSPEAFKNTKENFELQVLDEFTEFKPII